MSAALYMDHNVRVEITEGGVDVLTAAEDGSDRLADAELLDRASALDRVLVSMDEDLLAEAARRQASGETFAGVVYARQLSTTVGQAVDDFTALGDPVNAAARLASSAAAGEILVSVDALAAAGREAPSGDRRTVEIRGRQGSLDVVVLRPGAAVPA